MNQDIEARSATDLAEALAAFMAETRSGTIEFRTDEGGVSASFVAAGAEPIS